MWVHRLSNIDEKLKSGVCSNCGEVKLVWKQHKQRFRCSVAVAEERHRRHERQMLRNGKVPGLGAGNRGQKKVGVRYSTCKKDTPAYEKLLQEQQGRCAICRAKRELVVDHNHDTGAVRGLLCYPCNVGLGCFADDEYVLRRALKYLDKTKP